MDPDFRKPQSDNVPEQPAQPETINMAAEELAQNAFKKDDDAPVATKSGRVLPHKKIHFWFKNLSKKQKILALVGLFILITALCFGIWSFIVRGNPLPLASNQPAEQKPAKAAIVSDMTGLPVDADVNKRTVTGVMIENSPDARPQAGLLNADVIYEAVAEGGITRFLALFHDEQPKYIGPIRSARPYYLDFALPFNASLAHVGGSPDALGLIRVLKVRDLDQFSNSGAFERITSRYAPHNVYSNVEKLKDLEKQKGYHHQDFKGFVRKEKAEPGGKVTAGGISFNISSALYNVHYEYSSKTNQYKRSEGGRQHKDDKSGKQLNTDVVIALVMQKGIHADGHHTTYKTTGSGTMFVFQDGKVIKGKWKKKSRHAQFDFVDGNGKVIALNPGRTWISLVGGTGEIKYKP